MKKINKIFIMILIIFIAATGCKNRDLGNKKDPNINGKVETKEEDVNILEEQKTMNKFLDMINLQTTAADLGIYLRENIAYVNENHAEE